MKFFTQWKKLEAGPVIGSRTLLETFKKSFFFALKKDAAIFLLLEM